VSNFDHYEEYNQTDDLLDEIERLQVLNSELFEALEFSTSCLEWGCSNSGKGIAISMARDVIIRHTHN
jgi:hypothetical protein